MKKLSTLLLLVFLFGAIHLGKNIGVAKAIDNQQVAMIFGSGIVLGDDDEKEEERSSKSEDEDEDEEEEKDEVEHEEEREDEQEREKVEYHSEEQVRNSNGTTTYIKRETDDTKTEIELKTYDSTGRLIEERKIKQEEKDGSEGQEFELENYIYNNGDLQELKVKSKTGRELEIKVRESQNDSYSSRVSYEVARQELKIKNEVQDRELVISPKDDHFELSDGVVQAKVSAPLTVDVDSGEVFVETTIGPIRVGISPDRALEVIRETENDLTPIEGGISLEEGGDGLSYQVIAQKQERLFGLFPVEIEGLYEVNAETGSFVDLDQSLITRVIDLISV